jgi:hypothetical protein
MYVCTTQFWSKPCFLDFAETAKADIYQIYYLSIILSIIICNYYLQLLSNIINYYLQKQTFINYQLPKHKKLVFGGPLLLRKNIELSFFFGGGVNP